MNKFALCGAALAVSLVPVSAHAGITLTTGDTIAPIPGNNDFQAQLAALGLTRYTTTGAQLFLNTTSTITFEFLGSESGLNDAFTGLGTTPVSLTEETNLVDNFAAPVLIGSSVFEAGDLAGRLVFSNNHPDFPSATVGDTGFAIFLGPDQGDGTMNTFYFGYDDMITGADDDYDDFIVRATISAVPVVPEPATWALMILGFGAIGFAMRKPKHRDNGQTLRVRFA